MKTHRKLKLAIAIFVVLCIGGAVMAAYTVWTPITNVTITSHSDYDPVHVGQEYTLTCTQSTDVDCHVDHTHNDPIVHTWSGPGTFTPTTGTSVTWIPPATDGNATITVTASDNSSPTYANDTDKTDTVILTVQNRLYYVDADANGNDDGSSWTDAFNYLQDALDDVSSGDEIWVAEGTYYPDEGDSVTGDDRTETFQLVGNVGVYGGFAGTETARSQRDWSTNVTTLSGDIDKNDVLDSNNSYHVTKGADDAVIDGFVIADGNSNVSGGGMYNYDVSPAVTNCTFIGNMSHTYGGAMLNNWYSCPTLTNCIFENNRSEMNAGAIYNSNWSEIEVINCLFYKNTAYGSDTVGSDGGAIDTFCSITITNSTFVGNVSASGFAGYGGAVALNGVLAYGDSTLSNCIFWNNYATYTGGEMYVGWVNSVSIRACNIQGGIDGSKVRDYSNKIVDDGLNINSNPTFANSIDFSDATVDVGTSTTIEVADASIYEVNDVIEYNGDGVGRTITGINTTTDVITFSNDAIGSNSLAYRGILNWGQDATDLTFDLQIVSGSGCIDAADGDVDPSTDILGNGRYDDTSTTDTGSGTPTYVDIGAYEYQGS